MWVLNLNNFSLLFFLIFCFCYSVNFLSGFWILSSGYFNNESNEFDIAGLSEERNCNDHDSWVAETTNGMDGGLHSSRRRTRLMSGWKERLSFKGLGCCGATWGFRQTTINVGNDDEELPEQETELINASSSPLQRISDPDCLAPASTGMKLASALAAERQFWEATIVGPSRNDVRITAAGTPLRISLMRLLEESDSGDGVGIEKQEGGAGNDTVCCVCMVRKKGQHLFHVGMRIVEFVRGIIRDNVDINKSIEYQNIVTC